jgi:hypothetical protein
VPILKNADFEKFKNSINVPMKTKICADFEKFKNSIFFAGNLKYLIQIGTYFNSHWHFG